MSEAHRRAETPDHHDPRRFAGLTQRRDERRLPTGRIAPRPLHLPAWFTRIGRSV